jgi:hypothetical protein
MGVQESVRNREQTVNTWRRNYMPPHRMSPYVRLFEALSCRRICRIAIMGYDTTAALDGAALPRTEEDLLAFVDAYDDAAGGLDDLEGEIAELERQLNEAVYELYALNDETRQYIEDHVETPTTPIRPKAMSDEG